MQQLLERRERCGLAVIDGNINRVQIGNLAAYTDPSGFPSPAHWGVRILDVNGNVISDGLGLVNTFKQLGVSGAVGNQNFSSTIPADVIGTQVNFSLPRPGNLLIQGFLTGKLTAGSNNGLFNIVLVGPTSTSNGNTYNGGSVYITQFSYLRVNAAAAGGYTAKFQASVDNALSTFNVPGNSTVLEVIQFGA